jgi:hypothetical protein
VCVCVCVCVTHIFPSLSYKDLTSNPLEVSIPHGALWCPQANFDTLL